MFSSPFKNPDNIVLGYASLYLMESASNIENLSYLHNSSNYIGGITGASFNLIKSYKPIFEKDPMLAVPSIILKENILMSVEATITGTIVELSKENLSYVFGAGTSNILDFSSIPYVRVELQSMYPNKTNGIHIIFPKAQIILEQPTIEFFKDEEPM